MIEIKSRHYVVKYWRKTFYGGESSTKEFARKPELLEFLATLKESDIIEIQQIRDYTYSRK